MTTKTQAAPADGARSDSPAPDEIIPLTALAARMGVGMVIMARWRLRPDSPLESWQDGTPYFTSRSALNAFIAASCPPFPGAMSSTTDGAATESVDVVSLLMLADRLCVAHQTTLGWAEKPGGLESRIIDGDMCTTKQSVIAFFQAPYES